MAIIDLTAEFKDPTRDWTLTPGQGLLGQFRQSTQNIEMGLYGSLYHNDSTIEVVDKNSKKKPRCTCSIRQSPHGMTVIKASGRTLKSGMFNGGVIVRNKDNHAHLHRRGDPAPVCKDCFDCFFVLDLTGRLTGGDKSKHGLKQQVEHCETHWNRRIRAHLRANQWDDPNQSAHSESRFLRDPLHPTPDELSDLLTGLEAELVGFGWIT
jgi:hypothetical protein